MTKASVKADELDETELLEQLLVLFTLCKLNDKTAFKQLYDLMAEKVKGIAYRITRNQQSADKVVVKVFTSLWHNRHHYDFAIEPFAWLVAQVKTTARQQLADDLQQKQLKRLVLNEVESFYNAYGEFDPISRHHHSLTKALAKLAQKQSQAILMSYLYGYSCDDIAQHFNVAKRTVKSWLRRGLQKLSPPS